MLARLLFQQPELVEPVRCLGGRVGGAHKFEEAHPVDLAVRGEKTHVRPIFRDDTFGHDAAWRQGHDLAVVRSELDDGLASEENADVGAAWAVVRYRFPALALLEVHALSLQDHSAYCDVVGLRANGQGAERLALSHLLAPARHKGGEALSDGLPTRARHCCLQSRLSDNEYAALCQRPGGDHSRAKEAQGLCLSEDAALREAPHPHAAPGLQFQGALDDHQHRPGGLANGGHRRATRVTLLLEGGSYRPQEVVPAARQEWRQRQCWHCHLLDPSVSLPGTLVLLALHHSRRVPQRSDLSGMLAQGLPEGNAREAGAMDHALVWHRPNGEWLPILRAQSPHSAQHLAHARHSHQCAVGSLDSHLALQDDEQWRLALLTLLASG
mmetsp:Transcript_33366/g.70918  ORF Transcript_33366/g.70918 Transcript_33366/m.70918 type:complete len:383 (+) Transcript_33366:478-1626(+)